MSRCDECDPSYGCFDGSAPCSKAVPQFELVLRRVPKINPETGEQERDEFGEPLLETKIDMMATLLANPAPLMKLAQSARTVLDRMEARLMVNEALIGTAALPNLVVRHPKDSAAANCKG